MRLLTSRQPRVASNVGIECGRRSVLRRIRSGDLVAVGAQAGSGAELTEASAAALSQVTLRAEIAEVTVGSERRAAEHATRFPLRRPHPPR